MSFKKIVVLTGMLSVVRDLFLHDPLSQKVDYYKSSISLEKMAEISDTPYYQIVMNKQLETDDLIFTPQSEGGLVIIEEWHLGNIAWVGTTSRNEAQQYEISVRDHIKKLSNQVSIWYISTDIDKLLDKHADEYQIYIKELSKIFERSKITYDTLDGNSDPSLLRKRIDYLLDH
jgi:hypothetical protein